MPSLSQVLTYWHCKYHVYYIRRQQAQAGYPPASPDDILHIDSRDGPSRPIKLHVYHSLVSRALKPSPVLINFHGSGFVSPLHGQDDYYCRYLSRRTSFTVIDAQYRLAPEDPWPASIDDAVDVVKYILSKPDLYDPRRIVLSGFSAGGLFALVVAAFCDFPKDAICGLVTWYPATDITIDPGDKKAPENTGSPIPDDIARICNTSWTWKNVGTGLQTRRIDPRVSPGVGVIHSFPKDVLCITCGQDNLAPEAERWMKRLQSRQEGSARVHRVDGVDHAWDKDPGLKEFDGSRQEAERRRAYDLAVNFLNDL